MDRLRRMEIFVAIAETGQFTRAADTIGLTKSAVSHAVAALESYLGVQLLQRGSRGVQLTEAGQDYYEHCTRILNDIGEMEDQTRNVDSALRGRIKVTAPSTFAIKYLVPVIAAFSEKNPDTRVTLDLSETVIDLTEEQIDVAIRISVVGKFTPLMRPLGTVNMFLCASPDFLAKHGPIQTLEHLKTLPCLKYSGMSVWRFEDENERISSFQPKGPIITNNGQVIRGLSQEGVGICYMPDFLADDAIADGSLVPFEIEGLNALKLEAYALYPPNRHRPLRVRRFVDFVSEQLTN